MVTGQKIIKELIGHSGSRVLLLENNSGFFVRKIGNIQRNVERLLTLEKNGYRVPNIYHYDDDVLDMEYIHGLDLKTFLFMKDVNTLGDYIIKTLKRFSETSIDKDYTEIYKQKLDWMDGSESFTFSKDELIDKLPKVLPQSMYHGDMTLENILSCGNDFCLIDPMFSEYDSYIFDIAKMRQDLECKWFIRNDNLKLDVKLKNLQEVILNNFPLAKNDSLLILMLLRVYLYTNENDDNRKFIIKEVNRLWSKIK